MGLLERKLSTNSRLDVELRSHQSWDWRRQVQIRDAERRRAGGKVRTHRGHVQKVPTVCQAAFCVYYPWVLTRPEGHHYWLLRGGAGASGWRQLSEQVLTGTQVYRADLNSLTGNS
jgi:hypothetical protein